MTHSYRIHCAGCSKPIPLLSTTLSESGVFQPQLPRDAGTLQVVCPHCTGAYLYQRDVIRPESVENESNPDIQRLTNKIAYQTTIGCVEKLHKTLYTAISLHDKENRPIGANVSSALSEEIAAFLLKASPSVRCDMGHALRERSVHNSDKGLELTMNCSGFCLQV